MSQCLDTWGQAAVFCEYFASDTNIWIYLSIYPSIFILSFDIKVFLLRAVAKKKKSLKAIGQRDVIEAL